MAESKSDSTEWCLLTPDDVAAQLGTSVATGLSQAEAEKRLARDGPNELDADEGSTWWEQFLEQFEDPLVQILLASAVVSFVISVAETHMKPAHEGFSILQSIMSLETVDIVEPAVILLILLINALVGVAQERSADQALERLKEMQARDCKVLRDGKWQDDMAVENLVVGDVVEVTTGQGVPADCRAYKMVDCPSISFDQSALTGESVASRKSCKAIKGDGEIDILAKKNIVFSGTTCSSGTVMGIVTATGMNTEVGKIAGALKDKSEDEIEEERKALEVQLASASTEGEEHEIKLKLKMLPTPEDSKTPLGQKISTFSDQLMWIIMVVCVLVFLIKYNEWLFPFNFEAMVFNFKVAVALAVAAIPEGLPAVITTCLALGTRKMADQNAIVRKLPSVETLGCTTVICSDKTGTLTMNMMHVEKAFVVMPNGELAEHITSGGNGTYDPRDGGVNKAGVGKATEMMCKAAALCSTSHLVVDGEQITRKGNPTECALLTFAEKFMHEGAWPEAVRAHDVSGQNDPLIAELRESLIAKGRMEHAEQGLGPMPFATRLRLGKEKQWADATNPFSSVRKTMSVLCDQSFADKHLYVKGAPNIVIDRCTHVLLENGSVVEMNAPRKRALNKRVVELSGEALRCIGHAYKPVDPMMRGEFKRLVDGDEDKDDIVDRIENGLVFAGVMAMKDPPRKEVRPALEDCATAGIRVIVITGDFKPTAEAICRNIGLFTENEDLSQRSFAGAEFMALDSQKQVAVLNACLEDRSGLVFSRAKPEFKKYIVGLLRRNCNDVVAMTGDGVNDAPALKAADIGIAMGIAGTEVAKGASDMILADDNFATIVAAVKEGRGIYNNMKAFIRYMISSNVGEVASIFFTSALGMPAGLVPVQLLWVNLVTDGPPATALGFNPPDTDIMKKPPRNKNEELISSWTFVRYLVVGVYVGFATVGIFAAWYCYPSLFGISIDHDNHSLVTFEQLTNYAACDNDATDGIWSKENFNPKAPDVWTNWMGLTFDDYNDLDGERHFTDRCSYFAQGKVKASTLSLSVLVTIEMLNALNALSEDNSLVVMPPWINPYLLGAMALSFILHFVILYYPPFAVIFDICPLDLQEWALVMLFSVPVVIIDEILKLIGRAFCVSKVRVSKDKNA